MTDEYCYKMKAKIAQIITWANKKKFFWKKTTNFGDTPCDLITLMGIDWKEKDLFSKTDYQNLALKKGIDVNVYGEHNFKVGDIVELEVKITKKGEG